MVKSYTILDLTTESQKRYKRLYRKRAVYSPGTRPGHQQASNFIIFEKLVGILGVEQEEEEGAKNPTIPQPGNIVGDFRGNSTMSSITIY